MSRVSISVYLFGALAECKKTLIRSEEDHDDNKAELSALLAVGSLKYNQNYHQQEVRSQLHPGAVQ